MRRVDALILAGRANRGAFREASPAAWEALVEIAGRPMVSYVVEAVRGSGRVGRVAVVGPEALAPVLPEGVLRVEPGEGLVENLRRGGEALAGKPDGGGVRPLLVVTGDVPLLRAAMIDRFLDLCERAPAALHYPVIRRETCEARYPGVRRTYARLRDGTFTGGNAFLIAPEAFGACLGLVDRFFAARKSPVRLARLLGIRILIKFLLGTVSLADLEGVVTRLAGWPGRAVICPDPELGMDVDRPEHIAAAEAALRGNGQRLL